MSIRHVIHTNISQVEINMHMNENFIYYTDSRDIYMVRMEEIDKRFNTDNMYCFVCSVHCMDQVWDFRISHRRVPTWLSSRLLRRVVW